MKVSIIIPVYRVSAYIERCILSVTRQSYQNIECVIVDDASDDDSMEKCHRMIASYQGPIQFKILCHKNNQGVSASRNTGIRGATGDYVYFLDSDDEITPDCIEKLARSCLDNPAVEMAQGNHYVFQNGKIYLYNKGAKSICIPGNDNIRKYLLRRNISVFAWNKLILRSFILEHQLYFKGRIYEDILWNFYAVRHLTCSYLLHDITYLYHCRPSSLSHGPDDKKRYSYYLETYSEIIHNLTPGKEKMELNCYADSICKVYSVLGKEYPGCMELFAEYCNLSWRYRSFDALAKMYSTRLICKLGNGKKILRTLKRLKRGDLW